MLFQHGRDSVGEGRGRGVRPLRGELERRFGFDVRLAVDVGCCDEALAVLGVCGVCGVSNIAGSTLIHITTSTLIHTTSSLNTTPSLIHTTSTLNTTPSSLIHITPSLNHITRCEQNHVARNIFVLVDLDDVSSLPMSHREESYAHILPRAFLPVVEMALPHRDLPGIGLPVTLPALVLENAHVNGLRSYDREKRRKTARQAVRKTDRRNALENGDDQKEDVRQLEFWIEHVPQVQKQPVAGRVARRLDAVRPVRRVL